MTDIIIKRYRPEEFPRHLDFLERMTVTKGTVEDWHALKSLHYKTDGKPFAPTYYRCELDDRLVGVVVMAYPKLLLAPRHRMFPKLKPTTNTTVANQYWGRYVNNNFAVISRSVVDTQYRGVGVSYRMINLVSRMHVRLYIDPKCKHLIDSLEKVIYKPGTRDMDKTGGIEHSADALGYPVHRRYPVKNRVILGGSR